jgi:hypothetical protein
MLAQGYAAEGYGPDAVAMCAPPGSATLKLVAGEAAPYGALVRDGASTPSTAYSAFTTATDSVNLGPRGGSGEVLAFGIDRPVAVQAESWSTSLADQLVTVPFAPRFDIGVTIWIVAAPFASTQQTANTLWQTAQTIFTAERTGIRLASVEIVDATANPAASAWAAFSCGDANGNVAPLQGAIGARPGRINIYVVGLVDGSTSRGNACMIGGSFIAIASGAGAELLAHELGHDFALEHIDDLTADFDATNVMHSASNVRQFLTEGQVFRMHLRSSPAVNQTYALRSGLPLRDCDRDTLTLDCPPIRTRLWPDGAAGAAAAAPPRYGLSPGAYAVFAQWMATTCIGDEARAWQARLLRYRSELAPAFRRALADGPSPESRAAARVAADTRYRALATTPAPRVAVRQSFVDDQVERHVAGYKSNAAAALRVINR